jgi:hypothetical protein
MEQRPQSRELPGGEFVRKGIRDLARGLESPESLLVSIGSFERAAGTTGALHA